MQDAHVKGSSGMRGSRAGAAASSTPASARVRSSPPLPAVRGGSFTTGSNGGGTIGSSRGISRGISSGIRNLGGRGGGSRADTAGQVAAREAARLATRNAAATKVASIERGRQDRRMVSELRKASAEAASAAVAAAQAAGVLAAIAKAAAEAAAADAPAKMPSAIGSRRHSSPGGRGGGGKLGADGSGKGGGAGGGTGRGLVLSRGVHPSTSPAAEGDKGGGGVSAGAEAQPSTARGGSTRGSTRSDARSDGNRAEPLLSSQQLKAGNRGSGACPSTVSAQVRPGTAAEHASLAALVSTDPTEVDVPLVVHPMAQEHRKLAGGSVSAVGSSGIGWIVHGGGGRRCRPASRVVFNSAGFAASRSTDASTHYCPVCHLLLPFDALRGLGSVVWDGTVAFVQSATPPSPPRPEALARHQSLKEKRAARQAEESRVALEKHAAATRAEDERRSAARADAEKAERAAAMKAAEEERTSQEVQLKLREALSANRVRVLDLFRQSTVDAEGNLLGDGKVRAAELRKVLAILGHADVRTEDVNRLFATMDRHKNGTLEYREIDREIARALAQPPRARSSSPRVEGAGAPGAAPGGVGPAHGGPRGPRVVLEQMVIFGRRPRPRA